jgi:hypothetical protein
MATPIFSAIGVAGKCVESICITNLTSEHEAPVTNSGGTPRNGDPHDEHLRFYSNALTLIKNMMHEKLAIAKYPSKLLFHARRNFARMGAASEVAAATQYCWFSGGSCAIFCISEHAGTSEHLQTSRVCSDYCLDLGPDPALEGVLTIYVLAVSEMRTAFSLHRRLAWNGK